jgi:hypothetical protein
LNWLLEDWELLLEILQLLQLLLDILYPGSRMWGLIIGRLISHDW